MSEKKQCLSEEKKYIPKEGDICKPTDERIPWSNINFSNLDWDLMIRGLPWQIVRAEYVDEPPTRLTGLGVHLNHCIGGKYQNNNYYAYPLYRETNPYPDKRTIREDPEYELYDEGPTRDNLIDFNGSAPSWSVAFEETNYFRKGEIREGGKCTIFRNGAKFYEVGGREMNYGLSRAQSILMQLQEHPLNFFSRDWKKELIGRKVWYQTDPAIVESIIEDQGCVILKPDEDCVPIFQPSPWQVEDDGTMMFDDENTSAKCEYLYEKVGWFRSDAQTKFYMNRRHSGQNALLNKIQELRDEGRLEEKDYLELHKVVFQRV